MADDLDELLKRAMKTLDAEVPSEYLEDLPSRALSRLETSMQTSTGTKSSDDPRADPGAAPKTEEDSGLHDIRELARSSKQRISLKRATSNPPIAEDVLASSSGAWKAVALPEPAKMVSLPALEEQKRSSKAAAPAAAAAPSAAAPKLPTAPRAPRTKLYAIAGAAVAIAAGVTIYLVTQSSTTKSDGQATVAVREPAAERSAAAGATAPTPHSTPPPVAQPAVAPQPPPTTPPVADPAPPKPDDVVATTDTPPIETKAPEPKAPPQKAVAKGKPTKKAPAEPTKAVEPPKKVEAKSTDTGRSPANQTTTAKKKDGGSDDPSFDELLKEAGADQPKKPKKPTLDKKELSKDDFKAGMASVAARAQACYKGTQGTATVRITIASSGKVSKVTVGGVAQAEAACVEAAVRGATFPAWDGPAQSFGYSYLLSE
jgi:hypothetical protein